MHAVFFVGSKDYMIIFWSICFELGYNYWYKYFLLKVNQKALSVGTSVAVTHVIDKYIILVILEKW